MSLGTGLAKFGGKVFRIGHLGHFNDLMLAGTLSGVEMGLNLAKVPHKAGGLSPLWRVWRQAISAYVNHSQAAETVLRCRDLALIVF